MAVGSATSSSSNNGSVLTADEMLANAKKSAETGSGNKSAVQKLLAGRDDTDSVELSPVAKLLAAQNAAKSAVKESYLDSDEFIRSKVAQLKQQISLYSTLPDLDPSGGVMDSLTKQVNDLVKKQQDKLKDSQAEAKAKQAELDKANASKYQGISSQDMLSRSKDLATTGKTKDTISPEAQAMLDKVKKGSSVNKTA